MATNGDWMPKPDKAGRVGALRPTSLRSDQRPGGGPDCTPCNGSCEHSSLSDLSAAPRAARLPASSMDLLSLLRGVSGETVRPSKNRVLGSLEKAGQYQIYGCQRNGTNLYIFRPMAQCALSCPFVIGVVRNESSTMSIYSSVLYVTAFSCSRKYTCCLQCVTAVVLRHHQQKRSRCLCTQLHSRYFHVIVDQAGISLHVACLRNFPRFFSVPTQPKHSLVDLFRSFTSYSQFRCSLPCEVKWSKMKGENCTNPKAIPSLL